MPNRLKTALKIVAFFALGAGILYLLFNNLNSAYLEQCRLDGVAEADCSLLKKVIADFAGADVFWLTAMLAAFTFSNLSRAARWLQLVEPLGHRARFANAFWTIQLGYFANLGFPRAGEVVRAGSFSKYEKLPMEKAVGTLVIDRLMDFVCLFLVMIIGVIFEGKTILEFIEKQRAATGGEAGGLFSKKGIFMIVLLFAASFSIIFFNRKKIAENAFFQKLKTIALGFFDGLKSVLKLKNPGLFIGHSLFIWLCYFLQTFFCLKAFGPTADLGASAALMVFIFGTLGVVIPSPGGMGTYHLLAMAALSIYGVSRWDSFSLANISFFSIQIFYMIALGLASLVVLPAINRKPKN